MAEISNNSFNYDPQLYNEQSAREVLPFVFKHYLPKSIIDVGCGTGTWLSIASSLGIRDIFGIDYSQYDASNFHISQTSYGQVNLKEPVSLCRTFDLCICLEVAEHLSEAVASQLIHSLCSLAPVVLFSAAVPHQPGQNHINCQWPSYWQSKFAANGYEAFDMLRNEFWNNEQVEWWYKQNMILYARPGILPWTQPTGCVPALIHYDLYNHKLKAIEELQAIKISSVFRPSLPFALRALAKSVLVSPWKKNI